MVHENLQPVWEDTVMLRVKEEHDLVGIDLLSVPFEEFFQFFNQKALDK